MPTTWANLGKRLEAQEASGLRAEAPAFNSRVGGNVIWPRNKTQAPVLGSRVIGMIKSPNTPKRKSRKSRKTRKSRR